MVLLNASEHAFGRAIPIGVCSKAWKEDNFQVGVRDCVTFANGFATAIALKTPSADYRYPQDYVKELKERN